MLLSFAGEALESLLAFLWRRLLCLGYWEGHLGSVWLLPLASQILSDVLGNSPGLTGEPFSGTEWSPVGIIHQGDRSEVLRNLARRSVGPELKVCKNCFR